MTRRSYTAAAMAGKRSRDIGEGGETLTRSALHRAGFARIQRVHTPFKIIRDSHGKIKDAVPMEKVEGDFRAVDPRSGKSVLVETKTSTGDRIAWSALDDHQIEALDGHVKSGAIALLSIVLHDQAILLPWPVQGFGPGKSIRIIQGRLYVRGNEKGDSRQAGAPNASEAEPTTTDAAGEKVRLLSVERTAYIPETNNPTSLVSSHNVNPGNLNVRS